ncbi:MAG: response regulator [Fimbriimonadaceae bacterium]
MDAKVVLLVEDNADDERLTLRALRKNNIMNEVVVACDGEEALDYLFGRGRHAVREHASMPAVVLLDLKLPGMTGIDVLKEIRSNPGTRLLPVVVLTNSDDPVQAAVCFEHGANSFVRKPVDPQEFSETILQIGLYWLLLNQTATNGAELVV